MRTQLEKIVFGGRFLLLPMYLGLLLALVVYTIRFTVQTGSMLMHALTLTDTQILVAVLHLLDIIMVSHLIVMIMIGGYVLFIRSSFDDDLPATTSRSHQPTIAAMDVPSIPAPSACHPAGPSAAMFFAGTSSI